MEVTTVLIADIHQQVFAEPDLETHLISRKCLGCFN
jgi:hypothetical protein